MSEPGSDPTPVIEVTVSAPIEEVWRALRDRDLLRNWHGWDYTMPDGTDGLDAEIQVIYFNDAVTEEPPTRLFIGTDVFDLTEVDEGVRVRLTRAAPGANPDWDAYYDDVTEGWKTFLHQMKWAVERHPGQERVTHFTAGAPHEPGPIVPRLGLAGIAEQPIGSDYAVTLPKGISISGTVYFRTQMQFGLTVTEWGDGLLMVADSPPAAHRPVAGSAAVLSTYGLPAADLTALRAAWD
ncbi:MAG TPA: SRPBCC domain-containing protein, partial [Nakamurella sp.]